MRRLILGSLTGLVALAGCNSFVGPLGVRKLDRADALGPDGRPYSIEEQEIRGRQRYAITEDDFRIGPRVGFDRVDPTGH
jgi:hypothetical protein